MKKEDVLNYATPQEIYFAFLNLSEFPKGNISSPFAEDKKPSFKLYKNGTFKCHSTGRQGDCFQFVADINDLDCKAEFHKVLAVIADKFNIQDPSKQFNFKTKKIEKNHLKYWMQGNWNVSEEILKKYQVSALDSFEFYSSKTGATEKKKIFPGISAFVYEVNGNAEIYIPKQERANKFNLNKTTKDDIFGLVQLPPIHPFVVICAGKKDALILNANNIPAVAFRSENHNPTKKQIDEIYNGKGLVAICYDNDPAGLSAMQKIADKHSLVQMRLPSLFNDVADYFLEHTAKDFNILLQEAIQVAKDEAEEEQEQTIFHRVEAYLSKFYEFRYNEIGLDIEVRKKGFSDWESLNENTLYLEMQKKGIKISINNLLAVLKSDFVPKYNPLADYFQKLPKWNKKTDYISKLASYVVASEPEQFVYHFKKWLVRSVKCATIPDYFNKQAFVLVHRGQNTGKSTFCRFLCPPNLSKYIAEDMTQDKDARILLCKNFLINLDELAGLNKKELTSLKSIFSKTQINERLPYDRKNSILPRVCSFIGSTNEDSFLNDDTGSVRWLCFNISSIKWAYKKEVNINQVWSQAVALANDVNFEAEMTIEDIRKNDTRNKSFQNHSSEYEMVSKYVEASDKNNGAFMTPTDILVYLSQLKIKLTKIAIGKAMVALGHERKKQNGIYGYFVNLLPLEINSGAKVLTLEEVNDLNSKN